MTFAVTRDGEAFTVSDDNHASLTYDGKTATFTARTREPTRSRPG